MKKITIFLTTALFMAHAHAVRADNYKYVPYIGLDYTYADTTAKDFSPSFNAAGVRVGSEYGQYFGTELFFNQSDKHKRSHANGKDKQSFRSYGLDIAAYLPLGCAKKISLIATAGIGEYVFKIKNYPHKHYNEHGYGYRFGGGAKYNFTQNWQLRMMIRYVKFDRVSDYKHGTEYTAGVEYHFN